MNNPNFEKIKLTFKQFTFGTDGITSTAKVKAIILYNIFGKWCEVGSKVFETKITLKEHDISDLNKAYKYVKAKLEKDAYTWANKEATNELLFIEQRLNVFNDFVKKSKYIIEHNTEYLKDF